MYLIAAIQFLFLASKIFGIGIAAEWSWLWVFSPLWIGLPAWFVVVFALIVFAAIATPSKPTKPSSRLRL